MRAFCAFGKYHDIEVEDEVTAFVEYANGATGVFLTSTGEAPGTNSLEIVGDNGRLLLQKEALTFWRNRESASHHLRTSPHGFSRPEVWKCEIPAAAGGEGHRAITRNWVSAIRTGAPLLAHGAEGIHGVTLANAMLLSAWTNDWVDLPLDENVYWTHLQEKIASSTSTKAA